VSDHHAPRPGEHERVTVALHHVLPVDTRPPERSSRSPGTGRPAGPPLTRCCTGPRLHPEHRCRRYNSKSCRRVSRAGVYGVEIIARRSCGSETSPRPHGPPRATAKAEQSPQVDQLVGRRVSVLRWGPAFGPEEPGDGVTRVSRPSTCRLGPLYFSLAAPWASSYRAPSLTGVENRWARRPPWALWETTL